MIQSIANGNCIDKIIQNKITRKGKSNEKE